MLEIFDDDNVLRLQESHGTETTVNGKRPLMHIGPYHSTENTPERWFVERLIIGQYTPENVNWAVDRIANSHGEYTVLLFATDNDQDLWFIPNVGGGLTRVEVEKIDHFDRLHDIIKEYKARRALMQTGLRAGPATILVARDLSDPELQHYGNF